ncbi:hypothetical protein VTN77DRAFT_392 [Rasamsonia byssochlamydoides]|uniref:uncharacterized protein n=1 Tax=Rasamsonia byssochlamydoides TaxID=89139 RepID=UPI00374292C4
MSSQQDEGSQPRSEGQRPASNAESRPDSHYTKGYSLFSLLKELHQISSKIETHPGVALTAPGAPVNRTYPQHIVVWDDFLRAQEEVWDAFLSEATFICQDVFGRHNSVLWNSIHWRNNRRILYEGDVEELHNSMVEHVVQWIVSELHRNECLRERFSLADDKPSFRSRKDGDYHFCIQRRNNEQRIPIFAIEFKTPKKLSVPVLIAGFQEMQPARDVIDKKPDSFESWAKRLVAAAITEFYSYMVSRGVRHGYIFTGEAFLFLHIPYDDPSSAQCHLSIPSRDVVDGDEHHLRRTAVAQVLTFTLHAMRASTPLQTWYDTASRMETWKVRYMDVLEAIPKSIRTKLPPSLEYKPLGLKSPSGTRYHLRSRDHSDGELDGDGRGRVTREYCTMACLRGLVTDGALDRQCPNVRQHGSRKQPFSAEEFIRRLQHQLDEDPDREFEPLHIRGNTGFLLKASLVSHGYTVTIKAATARGADYLEHEIEVYNRLRPLQGFDVPVCIGELRPQRPYWYHGEKTVRMLVLSWAGVRLDFGMLYDDDSDDKKQVDYDSKHDACLKRIKARGADVDDTTAWRNFLWNEELNRVVAIDFERFSLSGEPDGGQKRKRY